MEKLTKIVATISDKRCEVEFIQKLYDAGINVIRMNTAHLTTEGAKKIIENTRKVSNKIGILIDTKGPEIRTTKTETDFEVKEGELIIVKGNPDGITTRECICCTYKNIVKELNIGVKILMDDGEIGFTVVEKDEEKLVCKILNNGIIKSRKSFNIPEVHLNLPSLNDKDRNFIDFAIKEGVTFIAHSFVRNKEDVLEIQKILDANKADIKIIAKIENQQGIDNLDEILDHVYGVMIARGDLGIEVEAEKIPLIQKAINKKCIARRKPVIVATQMLHTMIENPRPTRAEINDVANAIYDGTDAVMLSGETASGNYPVEAVETMARVAHEVEQYKRNHEKYKDVAHHDEVAMFLARTAVVASVELNDIRAIVADSATGRTIRNLAAFRSSKPIFAMCYSEKVMRELSLSYGVYVENILKRKSAEEFYQVSISKLIEDKIIKAEDKLVVLAGNFGAGIGASFVEISPAKYLLKESHF